MCWLSTQIQLVCLDAVFLAVQCVTSLDRRRIHLSADFTSHQTFQVAIHLPPLRVVTLLHASLAPGCWMVSETYEICVVSNDLVSVCASRIPAVLRCDT